ncbi:phage antirepressor N-terminal domain-containing protein [Serratia sp. NPDC078593]|uniref:phage antirepressor N-terminal domain-containing protein n=1 Tax=unclassified Serratia (in: enterobacteria) TaxID=2647522 RepID=UPI0037D4F297
MQAITVPFHGNALYVVNHNGEPYTPMRPIIDGMGLTYQGQVEKLKSRFSKGVREISIPTAGGPQTMLCLQLRKLAAWLATIQPNKVKPEIRDTVIQYQDECDDVLYDYWTKGAAANPRKFSVMEELNQACAEFKRDKQIVSVFGTGLNAWKTVKPEHESKISRLLGDVNGVIDLWLADIGKGKTTKT